MRAKAAGVLVLVVLALVVAATFAAAECDSALSQTAQSPSAQQQSSLATSFARALVVKRDLDSAMRLANLSARPGADLVLKIIRRERLVLRSSARPGCGNRGPFSYPAPCFHFFVRGTPVPDKGNPGYAMVGHGAVQVAVSSGLRSKVTDVNFIGGGTEVKLK